MSKMDKFLNKAKEKAAVVVDNAKNYDYKAAAENIKDKATDIAQKAKDYDYQSAAENIKGKATDIAQKAKDYDYQGSIETIKKNKGTIKKVLIIAGILIVIIAVLTGIFKIRKSMSLTPEDAIDNYFNRIDQLASVATMFNGDAKEEAEAIKTVVNAIDYKITSVDEDETSATAILEIEAMDMQNASKEAAKKLLDAGQDATEEEKNEIIIKAIKNNKKKVEDTITIQLKKEGKKWSIVSDRELQSFLSGGVN